jgi:hypothetical protein
MKNSILIKTAFSLLCLLMGFQQAQSQCAFTGLNPNYCTNSSPSTLVPPAIAGTFSGPGMSGSVFNPSVAGPGTHVITYSSSCNNYVVAQFPYNPSTTSGTGVLLSDDAVSSVLPIGFTFTFYCNAYTNFYISSNGFIEFSGNGANGCCSGLFMPNTGTPNNLIAACWTDLNPGVGGTITYTTIGTAPNRTLVVNYNSVPYFSPNTTVITSQIKLFETSNIIEVHHTSIPVNTGSIKTMGIENIGATIAAPVPLRNATTTWTATNECYRWTPGVICSSSQTTVVSPSTITVAGSNSICIGSSTNLNATGNTTYTWSTGANSSGVTVSPTVNTTYTVGGTNAFGCIANSAITVTVDNTPTVTAVSSNTTNGSCPNSPLTLTGQGATAYAWTGGVTNAVVFTPTISNTYTVTGSNACGSATAAVSVSIHPIPPITASVNNPTICSGSSVILNGGGGISYTWTPSVPNNVAFAPSSTFNYTVRGTSALGCTASAVQGVTVLITPSITPVVTPTAICVGSSATLSATGATGYTWSPGTNPNTNTVSVSPPGPTTYTLLRTNGPCAFTSTVNLIVNPLPLVNASGTPNQICTGTGVNLIVVGPITNTWLPGGFTQSNFTVYPNNSTCYTVTGSNGNCTASAVVCVTVSASPVISITSSTNTVCEGNLVNFTANGNATSYSWQPMNSSNLTQVLTPPTTTIVSLTGINAAGCTSTVTQLIIVNPVPNMSLTSSIPFACEGQGATISVANPSNNVVYTWNTGPVGPSIQVNPIVTTTYFASGTNTQTGCQNSNSLTLSVFISTFSVVSPTAICKGTTATLTASGPATSYTWTVPGAVVAPSVAVTPLNNVTYYVTGSNGSCSSTQTLPIIVNPLPNVTASVAKSQICKFEIATITGNGATSYSWNTGATTQVLTFTLGITTSYTLTGTDNNGCTKTTSVTQFVAICPGMGEGMVNNLGLNVYPNPNNGNFIISTDVSMTVNVVNALGQIVTTLSLTEDNHNKVTVSSLPTGIYFITGESKGLKVNRKIVVER